MRCMLSIGLLILAGACSRGEIPRETINGGVYRPLPEPWTRSLIQAEVSKARIDAAFQYIDRTREFAKLYLGAEGALSLALCETAEQYFAYGVPSGAQPPLILLACARPAADGGGPMLRVDSLNPNRETHKLVLLFYRGDEEPLRVEGSIPLTEKSQLFVTSESWRIETATWEDVRARMPNTAGASQPMRIELGLRSRIPMVIDSTVSCVAAVEDRTGRLSNFVPVSYAMLDNDYSPKGHRPEDWPD